EVQGTRGAVRLQSREARSELEPRKRSCRFHPARFRMNQAISPPTGPAAIAHAPMTAAAVPTILHVFSTFAVGGPQRRFAHLVHHFGARYRHLVMPMDGRTDAAALLDADASCEIQPLGFSRRNTFATIRGAQRILAGLKPDLLVTYNWGATEWAAANH